MNKKTYSLHNAYGPDATVPFDEELGRRRQDEALTALGVRNYVVCPTRLDERHCGVANDRAAASKTEEAAGLTPSRRQCYGNDTTKRDGGDRPRSLAARFPSFQFSQETDATDRNQTKKPTDRHN